MQTSESTKHIYPALLRAKADFEAVKKTTTGQHGKFANLETALEATEPGLNKNGVIVTWLTSWVDGIVVLHCRLVHAETGEYLQGDWPLLPTKTDPQGYGSAMTYGRRYTYLGLIGEAPEDDDGNDACGIPRNAPKVDHAATQKLKSFGSNGAKPVNSAPPIDDIPPPEDEFDSTSQSAGSYVIPFGKHKGKTLKDLGIDEVVKYANWLKGNAAKTGKSVDGNAAEFCSAAEAFYNESQI